MEVIAQRGEPFDSLLVRFKREVQKDGVLATVCNRKFAKPSERRKFKREKALARLRKKENMRNFFGG